MEAEKFDNKLGVFDLVNTITFQNVYMENNLHVNMNCNLLFHDFFGQNSQCNRINTLNVSTEYNRML